MLESRDILNYALAAAVLILTFFSAWILWYIVKIFREAQRVMHDVTSAIEKFNHVLDFTKEKISNAASIIPLVVKGGEKVVEIVSQMREKKQSSRKAKKSNTDTKTSDEGDES